MASKRTAWVALIMGAMSLTMMAALAVPAHVVRVVSVTDAKPAAVTDARDHRRIAELSAQVERLSQQLNQVARRDDREAAVGARTNASVHRPSAEELAKLRAGAAAEQARVLELDRSVDAEPRDAAWAPTYEAGVARNLREKYPGLEVVELKCARTVCRLSVRHASLTDESDFVDTFWTALPAFASAEYEPVADDHGSPATLLHIVRKAD